MSGLSYEKTEKHEIISLNEKQFAKDMKITTVLFIFNKLA